MTSERSPVVVVTGAAQGIGRAIARDFLSRDARVFALDWNQEALNQLSGDRLCAVRVDVSDRPSVEAALRKIGDVAGRIDVLVLNAAVVMASPFEEISAEDWNTVLSINLTGAFHGVQAALPWMGEGGRIVAMSSHSATRGSLNRAAYAASKGGLEALVRVLAVELAARGITVNAVAPGPVDTPHARQNHSEDRREAWAQRMLVKRYASEAEIAAAVRYLASSDAAMVTGQVLAVDGGMTIAGLTTTG